MKIKNILITLFILLATSIITIFMYDLLTNLDSENLATVTTQNNNVVINNQISARDLTNVTNTITNNITDSTNHTDLKDPATIALLSITSVLVLVVLCGTVYLIYNYLQLPLEVQQNINTIELQNM
uniref:hypothetical protein n=1 Tax=Inonotus hispidus TaxID=40469 RepID=UPI0021821DB3|nr:hypothetical protein N4M07_mgp067 [Inonotus hispidus]UVF37985.1 hypothetical protein [Inonotus hispidus]